jgi:dTDP-4-amino-4,6-dideoxygalactose transaminase
MYDRIYLSSPHMSDEGMEMKYIREAFDTNWIAPLGNNVNEFERELAQKVDGSHAAALSSGTAGIHMALKAVGVGPGDTVFCPSLTFSASANPIIYQNATPVFIDSDAGTWNISVTALEEAFNKYRPKAVVVVHLYGLSTDMDPVIELCRKFGVPLIEDAAESLGTNYKGKSTGTFGEFGVFSFNGNKIITTSGGGMVISKNKEMIEKIRFWSTQSRDPARHYQHTELGYNYRMSNVVAGIGRGQLRVLDKRVMKKREIFRHYANAFADCSNVAMMPSNEWNSPNYWLSCILVDGQERAKHIMDALESQNIESRPIWKPMHLQPFFSKYDYVGGNVSEQIFNNGICLPSDTKMNDSDLDRITEIIRSELQKR